MIYERHFVICRVGDEWAWIQIELRLDRYSQKTHGGLRVISTLYTSRRSHQSEVTSTFTLTPR